MRHTTYNQTSGKLEDRRPGTMASTKSEGGIIAHEPLKMQLAVRMRMAMTAKAKKASRQKRNADDSDYESDSNSDDSDIYTDSSD